MNERFAELDRVRLDVSVRMRYSGLVEETVGTHLQSVDIIRKDNDLITPTLVVIDQKLTRLNLVWIHGMQQDPLP